MKISRQGIYQALESPATRLQKAISYVLLIVILLSILALVVEERLPNVSEEFARLLIALDYVILVVFGVEYITRLAVTPKPWRYAVSKEGVIDVLALLPSAVSLFVPALWNISWLRALRLFRFLRVLKLAKQGVRSRALWSGILARIGPYIGVALAFKAVALAFEREAWWPAIGDLKTMLTVVGFAIGVLLATKLASAQRRMNEVEIAVCNIVGALNALRDSVPSALGLREWALNLERVLTTGEGTASLETATRTLGSEIARRDAPAPHVLSLQQATTLVLHRAISKTPDAYDRFLRYVTIAYTIAVIIVMPGLVGFVSVALVVYVLGGMYFLIEDMDRPIDHQRDALIDADISPLLTLNKTWVEPVVPTEEKLAGQ